MAWYPIDKEGSIPLDQEDCQPLEEVPDGLVLILSRGPSLSPGQLLDLKDCLGMPAPQRFHWQGDEGNAFSLTGCQVVPALVIESKCEGMPRGGDRDCQ